MSKKAQVRKSILQILPEYLSDMGASNVAIRGNKIMACCPLHMDSNPSFVIDRSTGNWACFAGCGKGDLFDLFAKKNGLNIPGDFAEVLNALTSKYSYSGDY